MIQNHTHYRKTNKQNHVVIDYSPDANGVVETTYTLPEKTKRGPPTNKNIPVRNMKAQITNMSLNENAGFKSEYRVRFFFNLSVSNCFYFL